MARLIVTFDDLVAIAKRTGVENWVQGGVRGKVISAPSSWRGKRGEMGTVVGVTRHHTGTSEDFRATEDYPTYQVVKEGRSGLDNSLSAYGLGRYFGIYVFSEDISWHAGTWSYAGITDGNGHFLGIEAESAGNRWTAFQREFYPRLVASILLFIDEGVDMAPRHADGAMPRGRKSDAANLPADFMTKVAGYLRNPSTLAYGGAPVTEPIIQEDVEMFLARKKSTGLVALIGENVVRGITSTDYPAYAKRLGAPVDLSDRGFDELVSEARQQDVALGAINAKMDTLIAAAETPPASG
jgi:hypothetical protein